MKSLQYQLNSIFSAEESQCVLRVQGLDCTGGNEQGESEVRNTPQENPPHSTILSYITEHNEVVDPFEVIECVESGESLFAVAFTCGNGFSDGNIKCVDLPSLIWLTEKIDLSQIDDVVAVTAEQRF